MMYYFPILLHFYNQGWVLDENAAEKTRKEPPEKKSALYKRKPFPKHDLELEPLKICQFM